MDVGVVNALKKLTRKGTLMSTSGQQNITSGSPLTILSVTGAGFFLSSAVAVTTGGASPAVTFTIDGGTPTTVSGTPLSMPPHGGGAINAHWYTQGFRFNSSLTIQVAPVAGGVQTVVYHVFYALS